MKRFCKEENGQTLILFALLIVVLVGFAGLAIDGGRLYLAKSQLQKAVDAGALAGGDLMVEGITAASSYNYDTSKDEAGRIAATNYDADSYRISFPANNVIEVMGQEKLSLLLMPVLGVSETTVKAVAQVEVGQLNSVQEGVLIPVGISLDQPLQFGTVWELTDNPGEGERGWYNYLDFSYIDPNPPNRGANALKQYFAEGSPAPVAVGDTLHIQPGSQGPSLSDTIQSREGNIVYVPIVEPRGGNSHEVTVLGFAAFELMEYVKVRNEHSIKAKFIKTVMPGGMDEENAEYGTYASKLVL